MCALSALSTAIACGTETFQLTGIPDQDTVQLFCPDKPPSFLDVSSSIPLSVSTGPACPNLLLQIGCEGSYCQGVATAEGSQNIALSYPILSPAARLRVRILGSGSMSIKWAIRCSGWDPIFSDQINPQWLEIPVPDAATQIDLFTTCRAQLQTIPVVIINSCHMYSTINVRDPAGVLTQVESGLGLYVTTYLDFPRLSFEAPDGRNLCASYYMSGITQCGASPLVFDGLTQYDAIQITCD